MALLRLEVTDLRCIEGGMLEPDPRATLIYGANGSGKTSLLEAIYLLGSGRSFRSRNLSDLVRSGASALTSVGRVESTRGTVVLGVRAGNGPMQIRLDNNPAQNLAEVASLFPVQVIEPGIHKLLEEGPARRRRVLDWGVFHVEHTFSNIWRRYQRALKQRTAALKLSQTPGSVRIWDQELLESGEAIANLRERYVAGLSTFFSILGKSLLDAEVQLTHLQGWRADISFQQALDEAWGRDQFLKATTVGPHRADMTVRFEGAPAKDHVSRGQQKLLAAALILAQQRYRASLGVRPACLLIDDPAAELDIESLGKLMRAIEETAVQLIATGLTPNVLGNFSIGRMFHVKQGRVSPVL